MDPVEHSSDFSIESKGLFMFQCSDWTRLEIQETASCKSKPPPCTRRQARSCSPPWTPSCPHCASLPDTPAAWLTSAIRDALFLLLFSAQKGSTWGFGEVCLLWSTACTVSWCLPARGGVGTGEGQRCCQRWLAPGQGGGSSFGLAPGKLSSALLVPVPCSRLPCICRVELLAEVFSSDHLLVFLVQIAQCREDTLGQQCNNGVKGEILQKRQDPPCGIQPPTNPGLRGNLSSLFTHSSHVFQSNHISGFSLLQPSIPGVEHPCILGWASPAHSRWVIRNELGNFCSPPAFLTPLSSARKRPWAPGHGHQAGSVLLSIHHVSGISIHVSGRHWVSLVTATCI